MCIRDRKSSSDAQLAAIAAKSLKETSYHLRHADDWPLRLGDGTAESHARMQAAVDHLLPYTQEFFAPSAMETAVVMAGLGVATQPLQAAWQAMVDEALAQATLTRPAVGGHVSTGKIGVHSEHLGFVLAEMQSLARAHPEAVW